MADNQAQNATNTDLESTNQSAQDAGQQTDGNERVDKAIFDKMLNEKRSANREAQDAKKRADAAEARLKEIDDKDKSELEKALAKLNEAEAKEKKVASDLALSRRRSMALEAGVKGQYSEYVATQLAAAQSSNPDLDAKDWFAEYAKNNGAFFGNGDQQTAASGQGGPGSGNKHADSLQRIKAIEERITQLRASGKRNAETEVEMFNLRYERKHLLAEVNK